MQTNNQRSFSTYIYKVLKRVHSNKGMSTPALESLDSCMRIIANKLGEHARNFAITENLKTVNTREVEGAVKSLLPLSLSNNAVAFATSAVNKFYDTHAMKDDKVTDPSQTKSEPKQTREFRAGLVFSVSLAEKYLRNRGCNVGSAAPVYLAAVLEFITSSILEVSGKIAVENNMVRIKVRHIQLAVYSDNDLCRMFNRIQIVLLGGGVQPHIDERLLKARNNKRKPNNLSKQVEPTLDSNGQPLPPKPKVHKFRPGTVSLRKIKTFQKSIDNQLCKVHMHSACDVITKDMHKDVRMTQESRDSLHTLIEQKMVEAFMYINELCLHAGRQTVSDEDFDLFFRLKDIDYSHVYELDFKEPGIRRLAQRAGVIRMGKDTWKKATLYIEYLLVRYLRDAVNMMVLQNRTVINIKVLAEGLSLNNIELAVVARKIKRKNKNTNSDQQNKTDGDEETDAVVNEDVDHNQDEKVSKEDVEDVEDVEEVEDVEDVVVETPKPTKVNKPKQNKLKKSPANKVKRATKAK